MILLPSSSVLKEKNNIEEHSTDRYLRVIVGGETAKDTKKSKRSRRKTKKHLLNKVSLNIRHYTLPKTKGGGSHKNKTQSPVSLLLGQPHNINKDKKPLGLANEV